MSRPRQAPAYPSPSHEHPHVDSEASLMVPGEYARLPMSPSHMGHASDGRVHSVSLAAVRRFKLTFLGGFLLVTGLGVPASWILIKPAYEATAVLQVSPTQERVLYRPDNDGRARFFHQHLETTVGIIQSDTVFERVLSRADVRDTSWWREPRPPLFGEPQLPAERLGDAVEVSVRPGMFLIDITVSTSAPDDAATIANAIHDEFLAHARHRTDANSDIVFQRLTPEEQRLRSIIDDRTRFGAETLLDLRATSPQQLVETRGVLLDEKRDQLATLEYELAVLQWQLDQVATVPGDDGRGSADDASEQLSDQVRYARDAQWNARYVALEQARRNLADAQTRYGPAHHEPERLQAAVRSHEDSLRQWELFLDEQRDRYVQQPAPGQSLTVDPRLSPALLANRIEQKQFEAESLRQEVEKAETAFKHDFEKALRLSRENEALEYDKNKYAKIRQRLDEMNIERPFGSIESIAAASAPSKPAHWKRPYLLSLLAVFAGLTAGFVASNWRAARTPLADDFSRVTGAPLLGLLPPIRRRRRRAAVLDAVGQESIRVVRTAMLHRLQDYSDRAVLVTSAGPGVGKTTLAILLAKSLASAGKRVLLVDADVRRPNVARRFGVKPGAGLMAVLKGSATDAEAIISSEVVGLSLLPATDLDTPADVELLSNGTFERYLDHWRDQYDIVLIDSCPVLPVADARILFQHVDGIILVAREGRCRQVDLTETVACLEDCGGKLLGMVFVESRHNHSYRSRYRDYCRYYGVKARQ